MEVPVGAAKRLLCGESMDESTLKIIYWHLKQCGERLTEDRKAPEDPLYTSVLIALGTVCFGLNRVTEAEEKYGEAMDRVNKEVSLAKSDDDYQWNLRQLKNCGRKLEQYKGRSKSQEATEIRTQAFDELRYAATTSAEVESLAKENGMFTIVMSDRSELAREKKRELWLYRRGTNTLTRKKPSKGELS